MTRSAFTMTFVRGASDIGSTDAVGGKARALAAAERAGLPVPPWVVLSADAFTASLTPAQAAALAETQRTDEIARVVREVRPSDEVRSALEAAMARLCPSGDPVAVRSSASDEDGLEHSFAGQLESFLFVPPSAVVTRVVDVWRSAFSERVTAYRREHSLGVTPRAPAVLIQRMVDARASGVAFGADPVSGRRGIAVVSAVYGLGTALVSGESDADTWHVDRRGGIVHRAIVAKRTAHRFDPSSESGLTAAGVVEQEWLQPALSDGEIGDVAALARRAGRHFGRPQDIEWAIEGGRLFLLQARPITSLARLADPDGDLVIWDNSNIVESYSGVTTPLTVSFASAIYEGVYRQFCRLMGVPDAVLAEHDDTFRNMLGLVQGRLYYNLLNWYRMLALLPGYSVNRAFMEQMMGVGERLPDTVVLDTGPRTRRRQARDLLRVLTTAGGLVVNYVRLTRQIARFYRRLDEALAPPAVPLDDQRPDELAAYYRELRQRLLTRWDAPLVNDFFAMVFYGLLRKLTARWCDDREGTLQNDLVGGDGGMVSAEPALRMQEMAGLAANHVELGQALREGTLEQARAAIEGVPTFRDRFAAYLEKFGERSVNELKLESLTLHDDPLPLLRAVGHLALHVGAPGEREGPRLRARARERVDATLAGHPLRRRVFAWVLRNARARVRDRENLRLERTRLFGRVRRIFLEMGERLHALELLDAPRDVFYLEVDEVLGFVEGRATCTDLRGLSGLRRREYEKYSAAPAPDDRFETRGFVYHGHSFKRGTRAVTADGDERMGIGCCPGRVRGPVRVVTDPRLVNLERRAILVAEHTDPGWIMVFPSAAGVLVERGSLLSHAAIVARELGIPAIVSIPGVTRWLRDGDWVEMDGASGTVRRMAAPE